MYYQSILDKDIVVAVQYPTLADERNRLLNELDTIEIFWFMRKSEANSMFGAIVEKCRKIQILLHRA